MQLGIRNNVPLTVRAPHTKAPVSKYDTGAYYYAFLL